MRVSTNVQSSVAIRKLKSINRDLNKEYERLNSGDRITRSAYDPAGLAISENMRAKIRSLGQARRNINDGISFFQMTEGTFKSLQDNAIRLRELALQSANASYGENERSIISREFNALKVEIERNTKNAVANIFGGKDSSGFVEMQIGINNNVKEDRFRYKTDSFFDTKNFYGISQMSVTTQSSARQALSKVDKMITKLASDRALLGSFHSKLMVANKNVEDKEINQSAANSKIRDADIAKSTAQKAVDEIKLGAATSMLKQSNTSPNNILKLL